MDDKEPSQGIGVCVVCLILAVVACGAGCNGSGGHELPEDLMRQGAEALQTFSFEQGYDLFNAVIESSEKGSHQWQQATYSKGLCAWHMPAPTADKVAEAASSFQLLVDEVPDSKLAPYAVLDLGRIREVRDYQGDQVDLEGARGYYQQVIDTWPDTEVAEEALLRLAGSYIQVFDEEESVREGVALLEERVKARPDNPLASAMWSYLAGTYFYLLNDTATALECYLKADELGLLDRAQAGITWWKMAALAEKIPGRTDIAVRYYRKIIIDAPNSGRGYDAQLELKRLRDAHPELQMEIPELRRFRKISVPDETKAETSQ